MVKIIKFKDQYFQECQWTGVKLTSRYGIPKEKARKEGDARDGSFADAACAVAWVQEQNRLGKIDDAKCAKLLGLIRRDLGLDKIHPPPQLYAAPEIDPANPDFSYRKTLPFMIKERVHVPVSEDLAMRKSGKGTPRGSEDDSSTGGEEKKKLWLYTVHPEEGIEVTELPFKQLLELPQRIQFKKIISVTSKSKDIQVFISEDSKKHNEQVKSILGLDESHEMLGTCYLLMKKPLYRQEKEKDGVEAGDKRKRVGSSSARESSESIVDRVIQNGKTQSLPLSNKKAKVSG